MHKHHEKSIENMKAYFKKHGAIALILAGSVAKGTERADSDLDGMVIVSEEEYAEKEKNNTTTETIDGFCTYEGGYDFQEWLTGAKAKYQRMVMYQKRRIKWKNQISRHGNCRPKGSRKSQCMNGRLSVEAP